VEQAKKIASQGIKEIVLTGVNIGDYGIIDNWRQTNFLSLGLLQNRVIKK
jgi:threonylcarbamoyladenosine tRNA methylthiotransferase MtaB